MKAQSKRNRIMREPIDPRQQDLFEGLDVLAPPVAPATFAPPPVTFAAPPEPALPMAPATLAAAQAEAAQKSTPPTQEMSAKPATAPPEKSAQQVKKVRVGGPERSSESKAPAPVKDPPLSFAVDDWWTTPAVCAFLKIGRKALWNMRRDPASDFPAPVDAVGHRHLYLAAEVRAWMDAQRETARQRAQHRRDAMRQFRDSPRGSGAGTQVT